MGACFQETTMDGKLTKKEVADKFSDVQDDDLHENGHSYSGGFGMARGLEFRSTKFATLSAASAWLEENAQKWEAALAVRATDDRQELWKGKPNPNHCVEVWVIGAWCSS